MSTERLDEYTLDRNEYSRNAATRSMAGIPRFGHSSNFADLWGGQDEQRDYVAGLLFAGVFLAAFLFAWIIILLILKCIPGAGFFNGSRFKSSAWRRNRNIRAFFIFSGLLVIIFAICFVTEGLTKVNNTVDTMNLSARQVESLSSRADATIADMQVVRNSTATALPLLFEALGTFCPADPTLADEIGADVLAKADALVQEIGSIDGVVGDEVGRLSATAQDIQKNSNSVVQQTDDIDITSWQSLVVLIPFCTVPLVLMAVAVLAWKGIELRRVLCLTYWVFLPLFIFMVVVAFAVSCGVAIGASANADFCSGGDAQSPSGTIRQILEKEGLTEDDLLVRVVRFYISACTENDAFGIVRGIESDINSTLTTVGEFNASLFDFGEEVLVERCGAEYTELILGLTATMSENLLRQLRNVVDLLLLASCNEIVPLFLNTFETGTCDYSIRGVTWMFSAFLIVGIFGMMMVTFRSSLLPDETDSDWAKDRPFYGEEEAHGYEDNDVNDEVENIDTGVEIAESMADDELYLTGDGALDDLSYGIPESSDGWEGSEKEGWS